MHLKKEKWKTGGKKHTNKRFISFTRGIARKKKQDGVYTVAEVVIYYIHIKVYFL